MLSYYDTLSFSFQKKGFLMGFCLALVMLFFFVLIGFSFEKQYMIFSNFKNYLLTGDNISASAIILTLHDPLFNFALTSKILWMLCRFILADLLFFSWQTIISKKDLFKQKTDSTPAFYVIALAKMLVLFSPVLFVLYRVFRRILYPVVVSFTEGKRFISPYTWQESALCTVVLFIWVVYAVTLFCGRFSFSSLLNVKLFFKNLKVVSELVLQIITTIVFFCVSVVGIGYCCFIMDPIYACFCGLLVYFICTIMSSSRWVFMTFFLIIAGLGIYLGHSFGYTFFARNLLIAYLIGVLIYFSFFFFTGCLFSSFAYSFASTSYVFRFNKTPAKDVKQQAPEKLRRIDELYNKYLKEHKNDVQDNFFHHMED